MVNPPFVETSDEKSPSASFGRRLRDARKRRRRHVRTVGARNLAPTGSDRGWNPGDQILPTRSMEGLSVSAPSFHLAGQTSPGCSATYLAAFTLRSSSAALRPMLLSLTSI